MFVIFIDTSTNEERFPTLNNPDCFLISFIDVSDFPRLTATALLLLNFWERVLGFCNVKCQGIVIILTKV